MASYDVVILVAPSASNTEGKVIMTVDAKMYEIDAQGRLNFFRGTDNEKVASFRTWDYVTKTGNPPP